MVGHPSFRRHTTHGKQRNDLELYENQFATPVAMPMQDYMYEEDDEYYDEELPLKNQYGYDELYYDELDDDDYYG